MVCPLKSYKDWFALIRMSRVVFPLILAAAMDAVLFENSAKNHGMILLHLWVVQKAPAELMPRCPLLAHRRAVVFAIAP